MPGQQQLKCQLHSFCTDIKWRIRSVCPGNLNLSVYHSPCFPPAPVDWHVCVRLLWLLFHLPNMTPAYPSAVSLFSQNGITEIRANNWVTLKGSWSAKCWAVLAGRSPVAKHSINQCRLPAHCGGRGGELGVGHSMWELSTNARRLHLEFVFALLRI